MKRATLLRLDRFQKGDRFAGRAIHDQFGSQVVRKLDDAYQVLPFGFVRKQSKKNVLRKLEEPSIELIL